MNRFLAVAQIAVSLLIIALILLQKSKGGIFASSAGFYQTLRGLSKKIFVATAISIFLFIGLAVLNLLF
jgi:protein translocase SecG subunit